jgi:hypothetical protein
MHTVTKAKRDAGAQHKDHGKFRHPHRPVGKIGHKHRSGRSINFPSLLYHAWFFNSVWDGKFRHPPRTIGKIYESMRMTEFSVTYMNWSRDTLGFSNSDWFLYVLMRAPLRYGEEWAEKNSSTQSGHIRHALVDTQNSKVPVLPLCTVQYVNPSCDTFGLVWYKEVTVQWRVYSMHSI